MNLPMQLRLYSDYIAEVGMVRFERPNSTVYAASDRCLLYRQQKAMKLLRHLDVSPQPASIRPLRRLWVMEVTHPTLTDFLAALAGSKRRGKIELIRRLGATVGMVHSLRHTGTGDIVDPDSISVLRKLTTLVRKNQVLLSVQGKPADLFAGLLGEVKFLWGSSGGTLVGNWPDFPPVRIWNSGLMIMDLSRANYSEPLLDLVNLHPRDIGLETMFFWEYFLQGYGATCELPAQGKAKIEVLYKIKLLQALAEGKGVQRAQEDCRIQWWKKV
ncbi:MAG TPA: hypothetical protein DDY38_07555 [Firmicutes bacterium]|jgi:hypothetical protein|nr:hypothetical protein [Bacillota bacterium]